MSFHQESPACIIFSAKAINNKGSLIFVFPAFVLGVFASKSLLDRKITNLFIWMGVATVIGGAWEFYLFQNIVYVSLIFAPMIGFFMSCCARKIITCDGGNPRGTS